MCIGFIVLAAGSGKRFGGRKLHAEFGGKSLIARALDAVPEHAPAAVVTGDAEIAALAQARGFLPIRNDRPDEGVSRSIRLGVEAMAGCDALCFLVADQPLLKKSSVQALVTLWERHPDAIIRAAHGSMAGNPSIFPRRFYPQLCALQGEQGGSAVAKSCPEVVLLAQLPADELCDCDTQAALYALAEKEVGT